MSSEQTKDGTSADCGASGLSVELAACPCGATPTELEITDAEQGGKWANVAGDCCGVWMVEFHTRYFPLDSSECLGLAQIAWNEAPRADN